MSNIAQAITPVVQLPGTHHCWAAVMAMVLRRQGPDNQTIIHQIINEARQHAVPMGTFGDSLDSANGPPALARAFGLNYVDLRVMPSLPDGNYFAAFLRTAPFGLFGLRPGYGLHAIAVNRLNGDFTALSTTQAHGIDPMGGGHPFSRQLFYLVSPALQAGADFVGHCVLWH